MDKHRPGFDALGAFAQSIAVRKLVNTDERAQELAKPEDQDWYGIGGRSARLTLYMVNAQPRAPQMQLVNSGVIRDFSDSRSRL